MKRKILFTLLAVFTILGALTAQQAGDSIVIGGTKLYVLKGTNLISNPGFEDGYTGWTDGTPQQTQLTDANFSLLTDGAFEGSTYLVGTTNQGGGTVGAIGTSWPIASGKSYYFCYYVKHQNATAAAETNAQYLKVSLTNDPTSTTEPLIVLGGAKVDGDGAWTKNEAGFTNSNNYAYLVARFRWLSSQYGFDNFALFEATVTDLKPDPVLTSKLQMFCDIADSLYNASMPGAQALKDVLDASKALIADVAPVDVPAHNTALTNAIESLKLAIASYAELNVSAPMNYNFLLQNPDLEASLEGWEYTTGAQNHGWATNKTLWDGSTHYWENWNPTPFTGQMFQTVPGGLPNGNYTLKIAAFTNVPGDTYVYAVGGADPVMVPVTSSDLAYYTISFTITNNELEFGLYIVNPTPNWVGIDNVTLTYWGTSLNALKGMIATAKALTAPMEASVAAYLAATIAQGQTVLDSGSDTGVDDAIANLTAAMAVANQSIAMYAPLKTAIDAANVNKAKYATYPGYADYVAVINSITQDCTNGIYKTADEIQAAIDALKAAERACSLTYPYTPADFTFAIMNPSFENGQGASLISSNGTYNVPNYWAVDSTNSFAGWVDIKIIDSSGSNKDAPHDGKYMYNVWAGSVYYFNLYQDVSLPIGTYTLTAVMRADHPEAVGDQHIYAEVDGVKYPSNLMTFNADAVSDNGGANWASFDAWTPLTVDFELTAPGTVRIGAESTGGDGSLGWFQLDDFRLMRNTGGITGIKAVNPDGFAAFGIKEAIVVKSNATVKVYVYSVLGQLIRSVELTGGETQISVPAGVYIVNGTKVVVR